MSKCKTEPVNVAKFWDDLLLGVKGLSSLVQLVLREIYLSRVGYHIFIGQNNMPILGDFGINFQKIKMNSIYTDIQCKDFMSRGKQPRIQVKVAKEV